MSPKLPTPIANYLAAVEEKNSDKLAGCFSEDAVVQDEGGNYRGPAAIRAWAEDTQRKYNFTMEALDASTSEDTVHLLAKVTGNFSGSPVELDYLFTLANNKIVSLKIE
jgi:ketosteroid isomerase-like protein